MIFVTRKEHFNAAHKLHNPHWTEEKNKEIFGKCANENWHGHNYQLYITVKGDPDAETGYVVDLKKLSALIKEKIIDKIDHRNINLDVEFMKNRMASTENLAIAIWEELAPFVQGPNYSLYSIKLFETENNFVEYLGK